MNPCDDTDLQALFARPAELPDSLQLRQAILARIARQQRRRALWLGAAVLAGLGTAGGLLAMVAGWPASSAAVAAARTRLDSWSGIDLSLPDGSLMHSTYSVWVLAALGLLATGLAAWRARQPH